MRTTASARIESAALCGRGGALGSWQASTIGTLYNPAAIAYDAHLVSGRLHDPSDLARLLSFITRSARGARSASPITGIAAAAGAPLRRRRRARRLVHVRRGRGRRVLLPRRGAHGALPRRRARRPLWLASPRFRLSRRASASSSTAATSTVGGTNPEGKDFYAAPLIRARGAGNVVTRRRSRDRHDPPRLPHPERQLHLARRRPARVSRRGRGRRAARRQRRGPARDANRRGRAGRALRVVAPRARRHALRPSRVTKRARAISRRSRAVQSIGAVGSVRGAREPLPQERVRCEDGQCKDKVDATKNGTGCDDKDACTSGAARAAYAAAARRRPARRRRSVERPACASHRAATARDRRGRGLRRRERLHDRDDVRRRRELRGRDRHHLRGADGRVRDRGRVRARVRLSRARESRWQRVFAREVRAGQVHEPLRREDVRRAGRVPREAVVRLLQRRVPQRRGAEDRRLVRGRRDLQAGSLRPFRAARCGRRRPARCVEKADAGEKTDSGEKTDGGEPDGGEAVEDAGGGYPDAGAIRSPADRYVLLPRPGSRRPRLPRPLRCPAHRRRSSLRCRSSLRHRSSPTHRAGRRRPHRAAEWTQASLLAGPVALAGLSGLRRRVVAALAAEGVARRLLVARVRRVAHLSRRRGRTAALHASPANTALPSCFTSAGQPDTGSRFGRGLALVRRRLAGDGGPSAQLPSAPHVVAVVQAFSSSQPAPSSMAYAQSPLDGWHTPAFRRSPAPSRSAPCRRRIRRSCTSPRSCARPCRRSRSRSSSRPPCPCTAHAAMASLLRRGSRAPRTSSRCADRSALPGIRRRSRALVSLPAMAERVSSSRARRNHTKRTSGANSPIGVPERDLAFVDERPEHAVLARDAIREPDDAARGGAAAQGEIEAGRAGPEIDDA